MNFDLLIVGGGPAGLAAAIRAAQSARKAGRPLSICLIDKGAEIGAHIISGAIIDPRGLDKLIPDWREMGAPLSTRVEQDELFWLTHTKAIRIPSWCRPACLDNKGLYMGSLGLLCRWLATQAEALGVEIYPGFAAAELLVDSHDNVIGVATGEAGRQKNGSPGPSYTPGMHLLAHYTMFAEGARGHLGKQLEKLYHLRSGHQPQTFSLGLKELWQVPAASHHAGLAIHTAGWPLRDASGGGFLYHYGENLVAVGQVVGLGYRNPWLSPYEEFQRFKTHPLIAPHLTGATRLVYGARVLCNGGEQSLPDLVFPGGALIGDDAGFLDPARLKGIHGAILSGIMAADAAVAAVVQGRSQDRLDSYPAEWHQSPLAEELHRGRNFKPLTTRGYWFGPFLAGMDQMLLRGHAPWTCHQHADHAQLDPIDDHQPPDYPGHDGQLSFDRSASVFISNTHHDADQPCHLQLKAPNLSIDLNLPTYAAPEQRYCPAGVYEIVSDGSGVRLQINATDCLHCKACDIKDPTENITWTPPQGGEGPLYPQM